MLQQVINIFYIFSNKIGFKQTGDLNKYLPYVPFNRLKDSDADARSLIFNMAKLFTYFAQVWAQQEQIPLAI